MTPYEAVTFLAEPNPDLKQRTLKTLEKLIERVKNDEINAIIYCYFFKIENEKPGTQIMAPHEIDNRTLSGIMQEISDSVKNLLDKEGTDFYQDK